MAFGRYQRLLRIWDSAGGRRSGWSVSLDGMAVAELDDCRFFDMFWDSYRVRPVASDPDLARRVLTKDFWLREDSERLVYHSREFQETAYQPCAGLAGFVEPNRLIFRWLYLPVRGPDIWDFPILWAWRRVRRQAGRVG